MHIYTFYNDFSVPLEWRKRADSKRLCPPKLLYPFALCDIPMEITVDIRGGAGFGNKRTIFEVKIKVEYPKTAIWPTVSSHPSMQNASVLSQTAAHS